MKMGVSRPLTRSTGAEVTFKATTGEDIVVFTTRPDTLFGATYMVVQLEENPLGPLVVAGVGGVYTPVPVEGITQHVKLKNGVFDSPLAIMAPFRYNDIELLLIRTRGPNDTGECLH